MDNKNISFLLVIVDQHILRGICAQYVAPQLAGPLCFIHGEVVKGLAIICPLHTRMDIDTAIGVDHKLGIKSSGDQILDVNGIRSRPSISTE
jgi:hypothetical protein